MKRLLEWLRWQLANFLSASRLLSLVIHLEPWHAWSNEMKLAFILLLCFTDFLDGKVARVSGNFNGAGKIIDAVVDKVMIFSVLWFLVEEEIIHPLVAGAIILGEVPAVFIAVSGFCLATRRSFSSGIIKSEKTIKGKLRLVFSAAKKTVLENWKISEAGRKVMVCYSAMGLLIFLRVFFTQDNVFKHLYLVAFFGGFLLRVISLRFYISDFRDWKKKYNSAL